MGCPEMKVCHQCELVPPYYRSKKVAIITAVIMPGYRILRYLGMLLACKPAGIRVCERTGGTEVL